MTVLDIYRQLLDDLAPVRFEAPVACVYNPLIYARRPFEAYIRRYGTGRREVVLVGMNPGPFGMAQTGVPFGDVGMVRDWMGIEEAVEQPPVVHPKRPIDGFACRRGEVSGQRLWGWARDRFGTPEAFFSRFMVLNYCPLVFMKESGANLTPQDLPTAQKQQLLTPCDRALARLVAYYRPTFVIGVGRFAEKQIRAAVGSTDITVGCIPHPSPASPAANRGWTLAVDTALRELGLT
jgi:single-strand selective monofunctional uracil DNA glycosylase